jgi:hypothetical protein
MKLKSLKSVHHQLQCKKNDAIISTNDYLHLRPKFSGKDERSDVIRGGLTIKIPVVIMLKLLAKSSSRTKNHKNIKLRSTTNKKVGL